MARGELILLSAPSGAGKTTLIRRLLESDSWDLGDLAFSVSHTTRNPRQGEVDGHDYHFTTSPDFRDMIARDEFLEWEEVHGNYYGTSKSEVYPRLEKGIDVVLDIDVKGAEQVMAQIPEARSIFIMPPSFRDLESRLRKRGLDDPDDIARRLTVSLWEIRRFRHYRYVIINDEADRAHQLLASIILERRHRIDRMAGRVESILEDFEAASGEAREPGPAGT